MADLTVTPARLREGEAVLGRRLVVVADEAITRGQAVYQKTSGRAAKGRANAVGTSKLLGIATSDAGVGQPFEALIEGILFGYDLSGVNPGATIYLSAATAGALADTKTTGTGNIVFPVGIVRTMTDVGGTKFLYVHIPQNTDPVAL